MAEIENGDPDIKTNGFCPLSTEVIDNDRPAIAQPICEDSYSRTDT